MCRYQKTLELFQHRLVNCSKENTSYQIFLIIILKIDTKSPRIQVTNNIWASFFYWRSSYKIRKNYNVEFNKIKVLQINKWYILNCTYSFFCQLIYVHKIQELYCQMLHFFLYRLHLLPQRFVYSSLEKKSKCMINFQTFNWKIFNTCWYIKVINVFVYYTYLAYRFLVFIFWFLYIWQDSFKNGSLILQGRKMIFKSNFI